MIQSDPADSVPSHLLDWFWARHSNPWSGGSRFVAMPVLLYALYHRRPRLLAAGIGFLFINPILFPESERTDTRLSEVVFAERWRYEQGHTTFEPRFPSFINYLSVPTFLATLYGAIRCRPQLTALGGLLTIGLKVWFVNELVSRYRATATRK